MAEQQSLDEGTAWATIGTRSTTKKEASEGTDLKNSEQETNTTDRAENSDPVDSAENNTTNPDAESVHDKDHEGNGLEIDMDAPMEPIQIEAPESSENTSTENEKKQEDKKNFIGDGFEEVGEEEKRTDTEAVKQRDRSRSRERIRYAESTNSSNPKKIRSRVFVGQINMDKCNKDGLEDAFSKYGNVVGSNLQNGYAFVQFDSEESALLAIKGMNKAQLFGKEIAVCKPKAWIDLDKEEARMDSRSQRAMMEELEYLRRKEAERSRYSRGYDDRHRGYDRGYDRYEHDRFHSYEMDRGGDRYGYYGAPTPPSSRGTPYYSEDRYDSRMRDPYYGGGASGAGSSNRSGMGGGAGGGSGASGYYTGSGGGSGGSYYGRRM